MPSLMPGYSASSASAIRWAAECQKVLLPASSSHVSNCTVASSRIGLVTSHRVPLTRATSTDWADFLPLCCAISKLEMPIGNRSVAPSASPILTVSLCMYVGVVYKYKERLCKKAIFYYKSLPEACMAFIKSDFLDFVHSLTL